MEFDKTDFSVFERYQDVKDHAFSNGIVTEVDRDSYDEIYNSLGSVIKKTIDSHGGELEIRRSRFSRKGGVQGQRPLDLWASIINKNSDQFLRFPQVYAIASEKGIEIGFTVWIHEGDYFNSAVKKDARTINPILIYSHA
tara:strand:+ start:660 stop:1079 length:420 start_codon:yes stop_codon:yes gene_type:complete